MLLSEYDSLKQVYAQLEQHISTLETRTEQDTSAIKQQLHEEQSVSNKVRSQLCVTNLQSKEGGMAHHKATCNAG